MTTRSRATVLTSMISIFSILIAAGDAFAMFNPYASNSATVGDGIVFDELNVTPNTRRSNDKPAIKGATLSGPHGEPIPVSLFVTGDRLGARDANGATLYRGQALLGLTVTIGMCDGREFELRLNDVLISDASPSPVPAPSLAPSPFASFWVSPYMPVESYDFIVKKTHKRSGTWGCPGTPIVVDDSLDRAPDGPNTFLEHLCKGRFTTSDDLWIGHEHALAFEGDYFDPSKTDRTPTGPGWFNLACEGTASAKMHLLRHTAAGSVSTLPPTSYDQRTTMLKAITADYCGDGGLTSSGVNAWTADGTPLVWLDETGWFPDPDRRAKALNNVASGDWSVEAIWGPHGALCLNDPRRKPAATATCPDPWKVPAVERNDVAQYCYRQPSRRKLPYCTSESVAAFLS